MDQQLTEPPAEDQLDVEKAGENSPHLDQREQQQAAERAPIGPLVIHEIVREQGLKELDRSFSGLAGSGLAAGLSIGFSFFTQANLQAYLPTARWQIMVSGFGYTLGFLIVILGQQQLFTETTLTALIPALTRRDMRTLRSTLRVWAIVLGANLIGTWAFAGVLAGRPGIFEPEAVAAMHTLSGHLLAEPFWQVVMLGIAAGWLIGLTVWLLPGAGPARPLVIILLTYTIALCRLPHAIAGSVEAAFATFSGQASVGDYLWHFLVPVLIGNTLGGTALVGLLNHVPVAAELQDYSGGER